MWCLSFALFERLMCVVRAHVCAALLTLGEGGETGGDSAASTCQASSSAWQPRSSLSPRRGKGSIPLSKRWGFPKGCGGGVSAWRGLGWPGDRGEDWELGCLIQCCLHWTLGTAIFRESEGTGGGGS